MTEKERVAEHLGILSILYYVYGALLAVGACGTGLYAGVMGFVGAAMTSESKAPPGMEVAAGFAVALVGMICLALLTASVCCILSGRWLTARRNRTFSQVVAGFACLGFPLGTALGVFTFVVLSKREAEELYREAEMGAAAPPHP